MSQWTADMDDKLKLLRDSGATFGHIATRLGITRNAAIGRGRRLGIGGNTSRNPRPQPVTEPPKPIPAPEPVMKKPETIEPVVPPVRLIDADWSQCRWPIENGREPMCCGQPGFPWCSEHRVRVYSATGPRKVLAA